MERQDKLMAVTAVGVAIVTAALIATMLARTIENAKRPPPAQQIFPDAPAAPSPPVEPQTAEQLIAEARDRVFREDPARAVTVEGVRPVRAGFDSVLILSATLKNAAEFPVRDVLVRCDILGASGTRIASASETIYQVVPAGGSYRFREVNMGLAPMQQAASVSCTAVAATSAE